MESLQASHAKKVGQSPWRPNGMECWLMARHSIDLISEYAYFNDDYYLYYVKMHGLTLCKKMHTSHAIGRTRMPNKQSYTWPLSFASSKSKSVKIQLAES